MFLCLDTRRVLPGSTTKHFGSLQFRKTFQFAYKYTIDSIFRPHTWPALAPRESCQVGACCCAKLVRMTLRLYVSLTWRYATRGLLSSRNSTHVRSLGTCQYVTLPMVASRVANSSLNRDIVKSTTWISAPNVPMTRNSCRQKQRKRSKAAGGAAAGETS